MQDYVSQIGEIAHAAGDAGLLVLLDVHVLVAGHWPDGGVVHVGAAKQRLFDAWGRLATALCDADEFWNIMGADLKNEPNAMWWGPEGDGAGNDGSADANRTPVGTVLATCERAAVLVARARHESTVLSGR